MAIDNQRSTGRTGPAGTTRSHYLLPLLLLLAACQTTQPYKMELAQGNFINANKILRLKPGMTKAQVANILGTPLLAEHVKSEEWEYAYTAHQEGRPDVHATLNLYFNGDTLARFEGQLPPGPSQVATAALRPSGHYRAHKRHHALRRHEKTVHHKHHHQQQMS